MTAIRNDQNIVQGHLDPPLSPLGKTQAMKLAEHLQLVPFSEAWTSDLARAEETAKVLLTFHPRVSLNIDPRLRSRGMGSLQGKKWQDGVEYPADVESDQILSTRLKEWLDNLITYHTPVTSPAGTPRTPISPADPGSGTVLAVTHEECLLSLLRLLTSSNKDNHNHALQLHVPQTVDTSLRLGNTAMTIVRVWWEDVGGLSPFGDGQLGMGKMEPRGRLEAWGVEDHLIDDTEQPVE
ncbi:histidine phosphatase superfamily [Naematelia encephala]|uniref:Histidine phosphatase superfamily n=1 Tax=Naematelia encephala TaxID=71784 RepID=A0A1Y2BB06_9TREE|nr:histidine phosphatase superfamily [Naematelia encephala]